MGRLFRNGVKAVETNLGTFTPQTSYSLYLGFRPGASEAPFYGRLDEVTIFDRALSRSEIAAIYAAGTNGMCRVPPTITTPPRDQAVTEGEPARFSVAAEGNPVLHYQWQKGTSPPVRISSATNASYTITRARLNDAGLYSVVVSNYFGSVTSTVANLTVLPDTTPPRLLRASGFGNAVSVSFSEPVDPTTAEVPANYGLTNALGPVAITSVMLCGETNVLLTTGSPLSEGVVHSLRVCQVITFTSSTLVEDGWYSSILRENAVV
jgi:hypothetical protein